MRFLYRVILAALLIALGFPMSARADSTIIGLRLPTGYVEERQQQVREEQSHAPPTPTPEQPAATPIALNDSDLGFEPEDEFDVDQPKYTVVQFTDVHGVAVPPGPYKNMWGVFVGISDYAYQSPLRNAASDALTLAETMEERSLLRDPIVLLDEAATAASVQQALDEIGKKVEPGDLFVLFFAGHGVGFRNKMTGETSGWLMLYDAPYMSNLLGGSREGLIDMSIVTTMIDEAGIDAKHKLIVLDCCYSGFATNRIATRGLTGSDVSGDPRAIRSTETGLKLKSTCVMTAGSAGQPVLDLSAEHEGHGLLTSVFLEALERPDKFEQGRFAKVGDLVYVPIGEVYSEARFNIPYWASNSLQQLTHDLFAHYGIGEAPNLEEYRCLTDKDLRQVGLRRAEAYRTACELYRLHEHLQNPQFEFPSGSGHVFLPIRPPAPSTPDVTPTAPRVTETPLPPTPTPTPAPTPSSQSRYGDWAKAVGDHYSAEYFGEQLERVLNFVYEEIPPVPAGNYEAMVASAEVLARPRITAEIWAEIQKAESFRPSGNTEVEMERDIVQFREEWRTANGANFKLLDKTGAKLSPNYEVIFRVANHGDEPLYCYLIALDAAGVLQWIAPQNDTWRDPHTGGNPSSGKGYLEPGEYYQFPEPDPRNGNPRVNPIVTEMDQYLFFVLTRQPWKELEDALRPACRESFHLYQRYGPTTASRPVTGAKIDTGIRTRALGSTYSTSVRVSDESFAPGSQRPGAAMQNVDPSKELDYATRTESHFLVSTWFIEILPADVLVPVLNSAN